MIVDQRFKQGGLTCFFCVPERCEQDSFQRTVFQGSLYETSNRRCAFFFDDWGNGNCDSNTQGGRYAHGPVPFVDVTQTITGPRQ